MTGPANVGDIIEHGQPVPANVVRMSDAQNDEVRGPDFWIRNGIDNFWYSFGGEAPPTIGDIGFTAAEMQDGKRSTWWPMTVVEVDP